MAKFKPERTFPEFDPSGFEVYSNDLLNMAFIDAFGNASFSSGIIPYISKLTLHPDINSLIEQKKVVNPNILKDLNISLNYVPLKPLEKPISYDSYSKYVGTSILSVLMQPICQITKFHIESNQSIEFIVSIPRIEGKVLLDLDEKTFEIISPSINYYFLVGATHPFKHSINYHNHKSN